MLTTAALYCTRMSCCFEKVRAIPLQYLRFPTVNVGNDAIVCGSCSISFVGITESSMENLNQHGLDVSCRWSSWIKFEWVRHVIRLVCTMQWWSAPRKRQQRCVCGHPIRRHYVLTQKCSRLYVFRVWKVTPQLVHVNLGFRLWIQMYGTDGRYNRSMDHWALLRP